ncbi:uncharacterized protein LOC125769190 [Anopheles funestus]|uniref:uncharacterized protein LOC125769190 n=1 Tax=Anopheles funestus TaxID=62324 RepID=UPI0020C6FFB9|nr:uncharacterized protein LOC125769190 [Anopheles funestus]XP_049293718.1 uncharacterized protein LOC125769190 [Anopheles funestus]XP_049293724.1 uncharacterized protein LOC125769190 [Anopheles funestus]XP_049293733.1 uncharacterized protein LOC125769190 [Anopheles funestus]
MLATAAMKSQRISFYYQNVRNMRSKDREFSLSVLEADHDVIILNETWLDSSLSSALFFDKSFCVYRCDRNAASSVCSRGGEVLIACSSSLNSYEIPLHHPALEIICVCILFANTRLLVVAVYLPPSHSACATTISTVLDCTSNICSSLRPGDGFLLIGDFNQHSISWSAAIADTDASFQFFEPVSLSTRRAQFIDDLHHNALFQINNKFNSSGNVLDLIFANSETASASSVVSVSDNSLLPINHHHPPLEFDAIAPVNLAANITTGKRLNFARADIHKLESLISTFDERFSCNDYASLDLAVKAFSEFMSHALRKCVPLQIPPGGPPWGDRTLRALKKAKRVAYRNLRARRSATSRQHYRALALPALQ